jgi:hypothetical protein
MPAGHLDPRGSRPHDGRHTGSIARHAFGTRDGRHRRPSELRDHPCGWAHGRVVDGGRTAGIGLTSWYAPARPAACRCALPRGDADRSREGASRCDYVPVPGCLLVQEAGPRLIPLGVAARAQAPLRLGHGPFIRCLRHAAMRSRRRRARVSRGYEDYGPVALTGDQRQPRIDACKAVGWPRSMSLPHLCTSKWARSPPRSTTEPRRPPMAIGRDAGRQRRVTPLTRPVRRRTSWATTTSAPSISSSACWPPRTAWRRTSSAISGSPARRSWPRSPDCAYHIAVTASLSRPGSSRHS